MSFKFVDLFAGIGGFHGALSALGGKCVYASEIDRAAARVYTRNWGLVPDGDITLAANETTMNVPAHDVLVGGFPCQPFSKSGKQKGMDEARGTLFWKNSPFHTLPTVVCNLRQVIVIVAYSSPVHPFGATFLSIGGYQPVFGGPALTITV